MLKWIVSLCLVLAALFLVAPLAKGHGGEWNHPKACKYYQGRTVELRQCIRKCYHPHDRSRRSSLRCVRRFVKKHP